MGIVHVKSLKVDVHPEKLGHGTHMKVMKSARRPKTYDERMTMMVKMMMIVLKNEKKPQIVMGQVKRSDLTLRLTLIVDESQDLTIRNI